MKPKFKPGDHVVITDSFEEWFYVGETGVVVDCSFNTVEVVHDNNRWKGIGLSIRHESVELSIIHNSPLYQVLK